MSDIELPEFPPHSWKAEERLAPSTIIYIYYWDAEKMREYARAAVEAYIAKNYKDHLQKCSDEVATWPEWKRQSKPLKVTKYIDEIDAAKAGMDWLETQHTPDLKFVCMPDDCSGAAPMVKWGALFNQWDELVSGYILSRDAKNWTQLTIVKQSLAQPAQESIPTAWYRGVMCHSGTQEVPEYDVDIVYGEDKPNGDGWIPLYAQQPVQAAVPEGWKIIPSIGSMVKADHPITVLNPSEYFEVHEILVELSGRVVVRGEKTCWFDLSMISPMLNVAPDSEKG